MDRQTLGAYDCAAVGFAHEWERQPPPLDVYGLIQQYFGPGLTADVGCGSGRDTDWLNKNGYKAMVSTPPTRCCPKRGGFIPAWSFDGRLYRS